MSEESNKEVDRVIAEDMWKADRNISRCTEPIIGDDMDFENEIGMYDEMEDYDD